MSGLYTDWDIYAADYCYTTRLFVYQYKSSAGIRESCHIQTW